MLYNPRMLYNLLCAEFRSCMEVEVAVLGFPSLKDRILKQH